MFTGKEEESMKTVQANNGKDVARFLMGDYLNSYQDRDQAFISCMQKKEKKLRDGFTRLILFWMQALSNVTCYDLRNEASVLVAQRITQMIPELPAVAFEEAGTRKEMPVTNADDQEAADLLAEYIRLGSRDGYREFVDYGLREHRTLQQSMTRLFVAWLFLAEKDAPGIQQVHACLYGCMLPFI